MTKPPPREPPPPYTPRDPPPPPSYSAAVEQKKANAGATYTGGGHDRTNAEIMRVHHPDGSLPAVLAAPIDLFFSKTYDDVNGNMLRLPATPSSPVAVAGSKRGEPMTLPSPASTAGIAKRTDVRQSPRKSPRRLSRASTSLSRRAVLVAAKPILAAATLASASAGP